MKHQMRSLKMVLLCLGFVVLPGAICSVQAQSNTLKYEVDPTWPKPLPENWVTGQVSGVCVDSQDHVFIVNRNDMTHKEAEVSRQAPPFIEFDQDGNVVNSFGDWNTVPDTTHGCTIDYENNLWTAGNGDGIIQKYSHDGRLLMQIGKRGVVDTSDGTLTGRPMNLSHTQLYMPSRLLSSDAAGQSGCRDDRVPMRDAASGWPPRPPARAGLMRTFRKQQRSNASAPRRCASKGLWRTRHDSNV
jgi:hypothetical protein